jgi:thiosulfate dehydrogenase
LEENSREMRAVIAYFQWLGKDVEKGVAPKGSGIPVLPFLSRAADPVLGKSVFLNHCAVCHGHNATGLKGSDGLEWRYPPLVGPESYSTGAGLHRLSRFAGYVKLNMPHGTNFNRPVLTDEEAWDVAAYINSLPRPKKEFFQDWPDVTGKPFDYPFGPYADSFSENQHKYGPFAPIVEAKKKRSVQVVQDRN